MLNCTFLDVSQFVAEPRRTGVQRVLVKLIENMPASEPAMPFRVLDGDHVAIIDPLLFGLMARFFRHQTPSQRSLLAGEAAPQPGPSAEEWIIRHVANNPLAVMRADRFVRRVERIINLESFSDPERARFYLQCGAEYRHKITHFIHDFLLFEVPQAFPQLNWRYGVDHIRLLEAYGAAGAFLVATSAMADKVCRYLNRPPADVRVASFGGDLASPEVVASVRKAPGGRRRRIVVVGTIEPRKYPAIVARAFHTLANRHADLEAIFVGSWGWVTQACRAEISGIFAAGRVAHRPEVPDDEMIALIANADVGIYVSATEGFGLPVIEFAAMGVPVVTNIEVPAAALMANGATVLELVTETALIEAIEHVLEAGGSMAPCYPVSWADCASGVFSRGDSGDADAATTCPLLCWRSVAGSVRELRHSGADWEMLKRIVGQRLFGESGSVGCHGAEAARRGPMDQAETTEIASEIVSDNLERVYWADLIDIQCFLAEAACCMDPELSHLSALMRAYVAFLGRPIDAPAAQNVMRTRALAERFAQLAELITSQEAFQYLGSQRSTALRRVMGEIAPIVTRAFEDPVDLFGLFSELGIQPPTAEDFSILDRLSFTRLDRLEMLLLFAQRRPMQGDSADLFLECAAQALLQRRSQFQG